MNYSLSQKEIERRSEAEYREVKELKADYNRTLEILKDQDGVYLIEADPDKEVIIARIEDYENSLRVGSEYWCISSITYGGSLGMGVPGEKYWNSYITRHEDNRQYFVWCFLEKDVEFRLVGCTTSHKENRFYCAYNFPNIPFDMEDHIIKNDLQRDDFFLENEKVQQRDAYIREDIPYKYF